MNATYERFFEGSTLFARSVGLAFSETLCSKAVRFRKDLVKRQLKALLSRRAGSANPVRVLSIGAGPAQELHELFQEVDELPTSLEVVLFEQDKNALAHAFRRLTPSVEARFPGRVRLLFLHDSIKRLLRDGLLFAPFGKFDLIYSAGLLDYLQHRTGIVLTRHLANAAAPGGQLLVANMVDHAPAPCCRSTWTGPSSTVPARTFSRWRAARSRRRRSASSRRRAGSTRSSSSSTGR